MSNFTFGWACAINDVDYYYADMGLENMGKGVLVTALGAGGVLMLTEYDELLDNDERRVGVEIEELFICCHRWQNGYVKRCSHDNAAAAGCDFNEANANHPWDKLLAWSEAWLLSLQVDPLTAVLESHQLVSTVYARPARAVLPSARDQEEWPFVEAKIEELKLKL